MTMLLFVPALFIAGLIALRSLNMPVLDQWEVVPIIQHVHSGHFLWSDFWLQHNEHRIFFPQLVMLGVALLTHWNTLVECFIGLLIAIISFGLVVKLIRRTATPAPWLLGLASLIWFSPLQLENWLWGWQLQWFMNVLGVVMVAFGISLIKNEKLNGRQLTLVLAGAILAQYSLGNGTLLWALILGVLIYRRINWPQVGVVAATAIAATGLYFWNYHNPQIPSKTLALHEPLSFVNYVLTYLGRPLTFFHHLPALFGFITLALFVWLNVYLFRNKRGLFDKLLPWTLLGLYAIGSALITGIARLGLGINEAYSSRYTTISSLLVLSVLIMLFCSRDVIRKFTSESYKFLAPAFIICTTLLVLGNWAWGVHAANGRHRELVDLKQCTSLPQALDGCLSLTYPNQQIVQQRLDYLKQIHWAGY